MFMAAPTISAASGRDRRGARLSLFQDGFRPFYLAGAIFAAIAVPLWLGMWYHGYWSPSIPALYWHMHEMVFGFGVAIIVGFVFTAARNWTGLPLPDGVPLALIVGLWLAGRVGMLLSYGVATAIVDSLLLVVVAGVVMRKFIRARSTSNMPLAVVLSLLAAANASFHASLLGWIPVSPLAVGEMGLMLVVLVEMIVGGRVVPGFSANAIPHARRYRAAWLQRSALALAVSAFLFDALEPMSRLAGVVALIAGAVAGVQWLGWNPFVTLRRPMVWVLHVSYAWIPAGLVLLGLSALGVVPRSAAMHAFGVGAMGGLIMGMITRTALGHSGRPVRAGRVELVVFVVIQIAAAARVTAALVPAVYLAGIAVSGIAWTAAFALYAVAYAPLLIGWTRQPCGESGSAMAAPAA
jgi:uncharacterized protein involved in response to NO